MLGADPRTEQLPGNGCLVLGADPRTEHLSGGVCLMVGAPTREPCVHLMLGAPTREPCVCLWQGGADPRTVRGESVWRNGWQSWLARIWGRPSRELAGAEEVPVVGATAGRGRCHCRVHFVPFRWL